MSEDIEQELTMDAARELGLLIKQSSFWRWMPGMLTLGFVGHDAHRVVDAEASFGHLPFMVVKLFTPDLRDPATVGCVLALLREFSGDPRLSVSWRGKRQKWTVGRGRVPFMRETYDPLIIEANTRVGAIVGAFMRETRAVEWRQREGAPEPVPCVSLEDRIIRAGLPPEGFVGDRVKPPLGKRAIRHADPTLDRFVDTAKAAVGFDRLVDAAKDAGRTTSFTRDDCQCEEEE